MDPDMELLNDWHVVAAREDVRAAASIRVRLLERDIDLSADAGGGLHAEHGTRSYAVRERYRLVWVCVGVPGRDILPFPEFDDARYKTALCGPYGVNTSAPRIVENFLDMAHLPYVHTGILGQEPHTEVKDYNVRRGSDGEGPIATNCMFWQPSPTLTDQASSYVNYTYRVPRPCTAILTKQPESAGSSGLSIMLTVTPVEQERSTAWILYSVANTTKTEAELRARQELVFLQDKGIVENQLPKRLPLDPNAERAFACDRLSVAYRRYLKEQGIRFGVSVSAS
jgi:phenylpropionate dioxygenase-like ring-hydroxylating dioxygenase large terminal subunit